MTKQQINHALALKILWEIHKGNNGIEELDEIFNKEQDFHRTINALSVESNPGGMINLTRLCLCDQRHQDNALAG